MATFCLEMANLPNNPNNWTQDEAFEVFEYTIECLTFFQDTRDILSVVFEHLPRDNIENLLRIGDLLSIVRRQVGRWDRCRRLTNRILKWKLRN